VAESFQLRFHKSLYNGDAVALAAGRFGAMSTVELAESEADWLVNVAPTRDGLAERLADELRNHALFETIVARRGPAS